MKKVMLMLSERKRRILQFIVDYYVATAEPVGSRTISKNFGIGLSPATIRNEMSDLEALGYLEQPHTSAGRIPSSKGYRLYVDSLGEPDIINENERALIEQWYKSRILKIDEVFQTTAKILSKMTNNLSVVTASQGDSNTKLNYIKFLPLGPGRAILLLVTMDGVIENRIVSLPDGITYEDLDNIAIKLSNKLHGTPLVNINSDILQDAYQTVFLGTNIHSGVLSLVRQIHEQKAENKVFLGGTTQMLKHPEFNNLERMRELLQILEERRLLNDILSVQTGDNFGIQISIGAENKFSGIQDCSVVRATYNINGHFAGTLAVLGPTRMEYAKVIAVMKFLENHLRKILN